MFAIIRAWVRGSWWQWQKEGGRVESRDGPEIRARVHAVPSVPSDSLWPHGLLLPGPSVHGILQEYWSGLPRPPPEDLPDPGIEPPIFYVSCIAGRFFTSEPPGKPIETRGSWLTLKELGKHCWSLSIWMMTYNDFKALIKTNGEPGVGCNVRSGDESGIFGDSSGVLLWAWTRAVR